MAAWLTAIGLVLNMFGVILLFSYGLPRPTSLAGETTAAERRRRLMGQIGFVALLSGTILQVVPLFASSGL